MTSPNSAPPQMVPSAEERAANFLQEAVQERRLGFGHDYALLERQLIRATNGAYRDGWNAAAQSVHEPPTSPNSAPPQVLAFGRGELVVTTGLYDKAPAVFIRRAIQPGTVGEPADRERVPLDCLADGEIVMTFGAASQCEAVANAIVGSGNGELKARIRSGDQT